MNSKDINLFLLYSLIIFLFTAIIFNKFSTKNYLKKFEKVEIIVSPGDTVWEIQRRITPNANMTKIIYCLSEINNKSISDIKPNDIIIFLKERK